VLPRIMKSSRFPFALVAAVLSAAMSASPCAGEGDGAVESGSQDELVPLRRNTTFFAARGRSHAEVERHLGPPAHRIYADVWVYWDCESNMPEDKARHFDTMILTFTNGRVSNVRLAPRKSVEELIARVKAAQEAARSRVAAGR
jgi:hypothetical protein